MKCVIFRVGVGHIHQALRQRLFVVGSVQPVSSMIGPQMFHQTNDHSASSSQYFQNAYAFWFCFQTGGAKSAICAVRLAGIADYLGNVAPVLRVQLVENEQKSDCG